MSILAPPRRHCVLRKRHLRDPHTYASSHYQPDVIAYMRRNKREISCPCARGSITQNDPEAASSNCHSARVTTTLYGAHRRATDMDVCSVNDLSAYVLLTSSSGSDKHAARILPRFIRKFARAVGKISSAKDR